MTRRKGVVTSRVNKVCPLVCACGTKSDNCGLGTVNNLEVPLCLAWETFSVLEQSASDWRLHLLRQRRKDASRGPSLVEPRAITPFITACWVLPPVAL
jgi:hypothetical protein